MGRYSKPIRKTNLTGTADNHGFPYFVSRIRPFEERHQGINHFWNAESSPSSMSLNRPHFVIPASCPCPQSPRGIPTPRAVEEVGRQQYFLALINSRHQVRAPGSQCQVFPAHSRPLISSVPLEDISGSWNECVGKERRKLCGFAVMDFLGIRLPSTQWGPGKLPSPAYCLSVSRFEYPSAGCFPAEPPTFSRTSAMFL